MTFRATFRGTAALLAATIIAGAPIMASAQSATSSVPSGGGMTSPATPAPLGGNSTNAPTTAPATSNTPVVTVPKTAVAQTPRGKVVENQMEQRINTLHRQLKITTAEQPQWDDFVGVMRENVQHLDQVFAQRGNPSDGTALDDMKAYAAITQAHSDNVGKLLPAFAKLYDSMSADQKKTADTVFHQYARQQATRRPQG